MLRFRGDLETWTFIRFSDFGGFIRRARLKTARGFDNMGMQISCCPHTHLHTLTHTHTHTHRQIHILLACSYPNFLLRPVEREGRILVTAVAQYQSLQFGLTTKKSVTLNRSMKFEQYNHVRVAWIMHSLFILTSTFCICYVKKCNGHFFQTIRSFFSFRDPFCFLRSLLQHWLLCCQRCLNYCSSHSIG